MAMILGREEIRREVWTEARRAGHAAAATDVKGARYAVWKDPENLTERQQAKRALTPEDQPAAVSRGPPQEQLRQIYRPRADAAITLLPLSGLGPPLPR